MLSDVQNLTELDLRPLIEAADILTPATLWIDDLGDLAVMPNLEKLTLSGNYGEESYSIVCVDDFSVLSGLTALKELDLGINNMNGTPIKDISSLPSMPNLTSLTVGGEFKDIQVLAGFPNLTNLSLRGNFSDISVLSNLTKLETLSLQVGMDSTEDEFAFDLGILSGLSNLKELNITYRGNRMLEGLEVLSELSDLEVVRLNVIALFDDFDYHEGYGAHLNLDVLSGLSNLKILEIEGCEIENFSGLAGCSNLKSLRVSSEYVESLPDLSNLEELLLYGDAVTSFDAPDLPGLKKLTLTIRSETDMSTLSDLSGLTELSMSCWGGANLPALPALPKLEMLSVYGNFTAIDQGALSGLANLKSLDAAGCSDLKDISGMSDLVSLETLDLARCGVEDLAPLAGLVNLKELNLSRCNVSDLSALSGLTNLKRLDLSRCEGIDDYSPVSFVQELIQ